MLFTEHLQLQLSFSKAKTILCADLAFLIESSGRVLPALAGGADFGLVFDISPSSIGPPWPIYARSQLFETVTLSVSTLCGFTDGDTAESASAAFTEMPSLREETLIKSPASFLIADFDLETGGAG